MRDEIGVLILVLLMLVVIAIAFITDLRQWRSRRELRRRDR